MAGGAARAARHIKLRHSGHESRNRLEHLVRVRELHQRDLAQALGDLYLPFALARKYPNAARESAWQYPWYKPLTAACGLKPLPRAAVGRTTRARLNR